MASRKEIDERRTRILAEMRAYCMERSISGGTLPPLRDLATKHQVSLAVAHSVFKTLQDEGLVQSTQGFGTRIVTRQFTEDQVYLYLQNDDITFRPGLNEDPVFIGMTDRFAERGAFTLAVPSIEALNKVDPNLASRCQGLYGRVYDHRSSQLLAPNLPLPVVGFADHADPEHHDSVRWDDKNGGFEATSHLLSLGHRRIVFVGQDCRPEHWSDLREEGYRQAMTESGWDHLAHSEVWDPGEPETVAEIARTLASTNLPDAILAASDTIATSLLDEFFALGIPLAAWPAIVGFDGVGIFHGQPIASMRMDGRELGRSAADLLWDRAHGALEGPPRVLQLPMRLVPRMTSQKGWAYRLHRLFPEFPGT